MQRCGSFNNAVAILDFDVGSDVSLAPMAYIKVLRWCLDICRERILRNVGGVVCDVARGCGVYLPQMC